jgi:hypothetical protein
VRRLAAIDAATPALSGGQLVEDPMSPGTGFLELLCAASTLAGKVITAGASILLEGDGPHVISGTVQARGSAVGVFAIDAYGLPGDITVSGKIQTLSRSGRAPGEFRLLSTFGDILITGTAKIKSAGAVADPSSELFFFEAASGSLTIDGTVEARATVGAYAVNLEANRDVAIGSKAKVKAGARGTGAAVGINSQLGNVTLRGRVLARARTVTGDAPRVGICASGDILVDGRAKIDTSATGANGSIVLGAGGAAQVGTAATGASLLSREDGNIEVCGDGGATITPRSRVIPAPEAVGSGVCLSPSSGISFHLDCTQ